MRVIRDIGSTALVLLFGLTAGAYAQDRQKEDSGNPEKQQGKQEQQKGPRGRRQQGQPQRGQTAQQPQQERAQQPQQQQQEQQPQQRQQEQRQEQQRAQQPPQRPQEQQSQQRQQEQRQQEQRAQQPQQRQEEQQSQQRQQEQRQQQQRAQQPPQRPQQQQQQQAQRVRQQPERTRQQAVAWQQQQGWVRNGGWQGRASFQQNRAQNWARDHRTWSQRGGYGGYYIPQSTFYLSFGRQHAFRIQYRPTMYLGYPRFSYGGYSFLLVDPWPEYWADNWYDSDDLYIDYDDYDNGYYLYNGRYPEIRLAISVAL